MSYDIQPKNIHYVFRHIGPNFPGLWYKSPRQRPSNPLHRYSPKTSFRRTVPLPPSRSTESVHPGTPLLIFDSVFYHRIHAYHREPSSLLRPLKQQKVRKTTSDHLPSPSGDDYSSDIYPVLPSYMVLSVHYHF